MAICPKRRCCVICIEMDMNSHQRRITKRFKQRSMTQKLREWRIPIIASLIKKCTPTIIAYDIAGVQPMTGSLGKIHTLRVRYATVPDGKFRLVSKDEYSVNETYNIPDGYLVMDVMNGRVSTWLENQPIHLWKEIESPSYGFDRYFVAEELCTLIVLKWA